MPFGQRGYGNFSPADSRDVGFAVVADADIALRVKYVGSDESGLCAVNAGGDLLFTVGDLGSESADASVLESGGTGGTIDVSDANADTLGEVVDIINADANWQAVIVDGLRSDSTNNSLLLLSAAQARVPEGLAINWDSSSVNWNLTQLIAPAPFRTDIRTYEVNGVIDIDFPFVGTRGGLNHLQGVSTYSSGTSFWQVISDDNAGTETIFYNVAAGATTAENEGITPTDAELVSRRSERMLVRLNNSAVMSGAADAIRGSGRLFRSLS